MDYYDVLGVRPSAGRNEIDLAFKGRRTQYHPDRYSGEDAETLKWATERMQQVNAAYAVLSDPVQRQRYDERRGVREEPGPSAARAGPTQARQPAGASDAPAVSWRDFLADSVVPQLTTSTIFCLHSIPARKLHGALDSYGRGMAAPDVTLLLDDTLLGGGQRGMLVTGDELRLRDRQGGWRIPLAQIAAIESDEQCVLVNGSRTADFDLQASMELGCVLATLADYLRCSRYAATSASAPDATPAQVERIVGACGFHMGPAGFSGAASCAVRPALPQDVLQLVRFVLGLPVAEEVLAWSNLDLHGHAEAFAVTRRGLHVKVGAHRSFMPWSALRQLEVAGEYEEGIRCGVAFSDGTRLLCSRLRGDRQTFGAVLMNALAAAIAI